MKTEYSPKEIIRSGLCIGCGSCVAQAAPGLAAMAFDKYGQLKPQGPSAWMQHKSEGFSKTC
ncbi:MAG: coenzyme F420 hydrogenase, partial [Bacteroidota bacterium]|nr:coenzyme F420 hydrogenase [Bacteroidota bacterium]